MKEKDIKELLENLGSKVSSIAEENRILKIREAATKNLFKHIEKYISDEEWLNIYNSIDDPFIKELISNIRNKYFNT